MGLVFMRKKRCAQNIGVNDLLEPLPVSGQSKLFDTPYPTGLIERPETVGRSERTNPLCLSGLASDHVGPVKNQCFSSRDFTLRDLSLS